MGEHRLKRAAEHPVQKRFAFGSDTIVLRHQRTVEISASFLLESERALFYESAEQCFHGFRMPVVTGSERFANRLGGNGRTSPDDFHHFPFRLRNPWCLIHWYRLQL